METEYDCLQYCIEEKRIMKTKRNSTDRLMSVEMKMLRKVAVLEHNNPPNHERRH